MKSQPTCLMLVSAADGDGIDLGVFVVATFAADAVELWKDFAEEIHGRPAPEEFISGIRIVLPDVAGTIYDGEDRIVPWSELNTIFDRDA